MLRHRLLFDGDSVLAILKRNNGSLFIPSPASCFQDSAGTTPCAVDDPVGFLRDDINARNATQATAGFKPILRGKVKNLFGWSETLNNWSKSAAGTGSVPVVTDNYALAPDGSMTASRVQLNLNSGTSSGDTTSLLNILGGGSGIIRTRSGWVKTNDGTTKVITAQIGGGGSGTLITVTPDWTYFINSTIDDANNSGFGLRGNYIALGQSSSADILVWHPMLENGSIASGDYVATTSAAKSSSYGPYWLDFDGADDRLDVNTVPIPAASLFCAIASALPLSNSATMFSESDTVSTDALISLGTDSANTAANIRRDNAASSSKATIASTLGPKKIFTGYYDRTKNSIRINSSEGTSANTAQGATTLTTAVVGARNNGTYNTFFKGSIYTLGIVPNMLSGQDLLKVERYLARVTGVTL